MANDAGDEFQIVVKVKGSPNERFLFMKMKNRRVTFMSYPALSEEELDEKLYQMGYSLTEINSLKAEAREKPV